MPARRMVPVVITLIILSLVLLSASPRSTAPTLTGVPTLSLTQSHFALTSALDWLVQHYHSWSPGFEGSMAPAAYALWLNDSGSQPAEGSFQYLESALNNGTSWFWTGQFRESDVAGIALFTISASQRLSQLRTQTDVASRLLHLQRPNGGFEGLEDASGKVLTSSVDTAMALWGLSYAGTISPENQTTAVDYLLSLQNRDGSFNLTSTDVAEPFYSLGPDSVSITAATILAMRESGFVPTSPPIAKAIGFLTNEASAGFRGSGHVYAASLSTLAFLQNYHPKEAKDSLSYLLTQQNRDGGFGDVTRYTPGSNAMDTGWASIALQFGISNDVASVSAVNQPPKAFFTFSPQNPTNGTSVSFDAGSSYDSDGDHLQYYWTFGDGGSASGQQVTHSYSQSGTYTVTMTVIDSGTNPNQLTGTTWSSITVESSSTLHAATQPTTNDLSLEAGIAALAAAVIIGGYLVIRTNKKRRAKIGPLPRV